MGCSASVRKAPEISSPNTTGERENKIFAKLQALSNGENKINDNELDLIRRTIQRIQELDSSRRNLWFEAIHDDILSPLYFSTLDTLRYDERNSFIPNPVKLMHLRDKDFDSLNISKEEMEDCLLHIFSEFIPTFNLDIKKLQRFIHAIGENYQDNPFHNFNHGFCVTQMCFSVAEKANKLARFIFDKDRFALYICAVGHDLNHRNLYSAGVNNAFMINSKHQLALRYNDISVLENHHAATLFQILGLEGCDIFDTFTPSERTYLRKVMIPTILATDMAKHKQVMDHFRGVVSEFSKDDENHRQGVMDMILHSADVGNPAFKFELATVWSLKIVQEFNEQVWKEEQYKIPVSEFLRIGNDIQNIKKSQIGFISKVYAAFFIQPLWELLAEHVHEAKEYVDSIVANRIKWEQIQRL